MHLTSCQIGLGTPSLLAAVCPLVAEDPSPFGVQEQPPRAVASLERSQSDRMRHAPVQTLDPRRAGSLPRRSVRLSRKSTPGLSSR
ncbi:hypothetical protein DFJ67_2320 [Asanoa ferruginea]|uniref:Uncharacterized protein n=1 Tax=Asanoa ferruginea TaxID=53367 RepID=A0A3D9ZK90_9ACTN|nr:hypothetical protein DFJ67_2320 [Asanoa ferruginea]